ncbi:MAG TPA: hypothetical protein ENI51_02680 [Candidatus Atribacteria bacterium]|nr:hypothetical protein [Candidatus Atribacteria bacterium]
MSIKAHSKKYVIDPKELAVLNDKVIYELISIGIFNYSRSRWDISGLDELEAKLNNLIQKKKITDGVKKFIIEIWNLRDRYKENRKLLAKKFWRTAYRFYEGYKIITRHYNCDKDKSKTYALYEVRFELLGAALELLFKSFLFQNGSRLKKVKEKGHNLEALFDAVDRITRVKNLNFSLTKTEKDLIKVLNLHYMKQEFPYERLEFYLPDEQQIKGLEEMIKKMLENFKVRNPKRDLVSI